jgi:bacterioferritin-associated ferredoxin
VLRVLVCHCKAVSDRQIGSVVATGASDLRTVARATHAGTGCGGCLQALRALVEQALGPAPAASDRLTARRAG